MLSSSLLVYPWESKTKTLAYAPDTKSEAEIQSIKETRPEIVHAAYSFSTHVTTKDGPTLWLRVTREAFDNARKPKGSLSLLDWRLRSSFTHLQPFWVLV